MPLELQANWVGEVAVVRCRGRLVAGEDVRALRAEVERLMKETRQIVLQMEEVSGMDSSGVGRAGHMKRATLELTATASPKKPWLFRSTSERLSLRNSKGHPIAMAR